MSASIRDPREIPANSPSRKRIEIPEDIPPFIPPHIIKQIINRRPIQPPRKDYIIPVPPDEPFTPSNGGDKPHDPPRGVAEINYSVAGFYSR